jgi:hypothetical protein
MASRALKLVDAGSGIGELREFADGDALTLAGAVNGAAPVSIASASTVNIGAAASNNITITGTTTITAFDSIAAGAERTVVFAAALTLTHSGTSLILPGAANITTVAGDTATFLSLGSGNWRCTSYQAPQLIKRYTSGLLAYTAGSPITVVHGLAGTLFSVSADAVCIAADGAFVVDDVVVMQTATDSPSTSTSGTYGLSIKKTATSLIVRPGTSGLAGMNNSTGLGFVMNPACWRLVLRVLAIADS